MLVGHPRVDEPPAERRVDELLRPRQAISRSRQDERRPAHRLHAAGHADVAVAEGEIGGRPVERVEARAAQPVDGRSRHRVRQPGEEHGHAGDVAVVLAGLVGGAPHDVGDLRRIERGVAAEEGAEHRRREVVGTDVAQGAAMAADRRPAAVDRRYTFIASLIVFT